MKNSRLYKTSSSKKIDIKTKLAISNVKSADIDILLNRVRLDEKKIRNKNFFYLSLTVCTFLITGFLIVL